MLVARMSDQRQPSPSPPPSSSFAPSSPKPMSAPSPSPSPSPAVPPAPSAQPSSRKTAHPAPPSASASASAPPTTPPPPPPASADLNPAAGSSSHPSPPPSPSLSSAKATLDPSSSASTSTANPNPTAAPVTGTTGAAKIPSRPRKTRKLAAQARAPQGDAKAEEAATDGGGNSIGDAMVVAGGAAQAEAGGSRSRVVYRVLPRPLSAEGEVAAAIRRLRAADPQLSRVIEAHEPPVFQSLHPPFHSLTRSILYQQLAYKAATSIYSRFLALCGGEAGVVPEAVLGLTPHQLRQIGVSARKASYLHDLANKYRNGILSDAAIVAMDDKSLFTMLTMVKGIGAWSVHMFMIFSLHRPDVLPVGDLGVRKGVQLLYGLDSLPRPSQMEQLCERWKPYRSVGSWYMWRLVEAKGAPAALATVPSIGAAVTATAGGVGGVCAAPLVGAVPSTLPPLPLQHQPLQRQVQQQQQPQQPQPQPQHQHPHPHPHPHPHQHHQHQHPQQLQMQTQLVDPIQSISNLR